jgi:hypothetical protein
MSAVRVITDDGQEPDSPPVATEEVPGALLDRLRRQSSRIREGRILDKPVPGFEGALILRFKPLDMGQLERFVDARRAGKVSEISEGVEALATCCIGVYALDGDRLTELPAGLDHRLAELLGWPIPPGATLTAREVVLTLFGGEAFLIGNFVDSVVEWMSNLDGGDSGEA